MRKLTLDVDSLVVQTFETTDETKDRGTVRAYDSWGTTGGPWFCPYYCDSGDRTCGC